MPPPAIRISPNFEAFDTSEEPGLVALDSIIGLVSNMESARTEKAALEDLATATEKQNPYLASVIRSQAKNINVFTVGGGVGAGVGTARSGGGVRGGVGSSSLFQSIINSSIEAEADQRRFDLKKEFEDISNQNLMDRIGATRQAQLDVQGVKAQDDRDLAILRDRLGEEANTPQGKARLAEEKTRLAEDREEKIRQFNVSEKRLMFDANTDRLKFESELSVGSDTEKFNGIGERLTRREFQDRYLDASSSEKTIMEYNFAKQHNVVPFGVENFEDYKKLKSEEIIESDDPLLSSTQDKIVAKGHMNKLINIMENYADLGKGPAPDSAPAVTQPVQGAESLGMDAFLQEGNKFQK